MLGYDGERGKEESWGWNPPPSGMSYHKKDPEKDSSTDDRSCGVRLGNKILRQCRRGRVAGGGSHCVRTAWRPGFLLSTEEGRSRARIHPGSGALEKKWSPKKNQ